MRVKIKKIQKLLLRMLVSALIVCQALPVYAASQTVFSVSNNVSSVAPGQTISTAVRVTPGQAINGISVSLCFDPQILKVIGVSGDGSSFPVTLAQATSSNCVHMERGFLGGTVVDSGLVSTITFQALAAGTSSLILSDVAATADGQYVAVGANNGSISVIAPTEPVSQPSASTGSNTPSTAPSKSSSPSSTASSKASPSNTSVPAATQPASGDSAKSSESPPTVSAESSPNAVTFPEVTMKENISTGKSWNNWPWVGAAVLALAVATIGWWLLTRHKKSRSFVVIALYVTGTLVSCATFLPTYRAAAACSSLPAASGTITTSVTIPSAGTYAVWSRVRTHTPASDTFYFQLGDVLCNVSVGGVTLTADTWTWVNYRDGNTSNTITATLAATTYPIYLAGKDDGVQVDRILLTRDLTCTPSGMGSNCNGTTTYLLEDINQDTHVNILDFSILAANYGKSSAAIKNSRSDINNDNVVNLADFSLLSVKYGKI